MNIKSKRFLTVFLTLIFAVTVFTLTAFAESNATVAVDPPGQEPTSSISTGGGSSHSEDTSQGGTSSQPGETSQPDGNSQGESSQPDQNSQAESAVSNPESSRATAVSSKEPVVNHYVDTHTNEVEKRASQAAQTVSDPDVLSSQDWGELLSSGDSSSSETVAAAGTVSSEAETPSGIGGVSRLLILGVVLIVLALCGIGLFIYLQFFFQGRRQNLKFAPAGGVQEADEPETFEDISSYSDEEQHPTAAVSDDTQSFTDIQSSSNETEAPAAAEPTPAAKSRIIAKHRPAAKPQPEKRPVNPDQEETAPIPQDLLNRSNPSVSSSDPDSLPKSQAQPIQDSNFDWEKFFNEEK